MNDKKCNGVYCAAEVAFNKMDAAEDWFESVPGLCVADRTHTTQTTHKTLAEIDTAFDFISDADRVALQCAWEQFWASERERILING